MSQSDEAARLKKFVKTVTRGGCRMFSQGEFCQCPLCDIDHLTATINDQDKLIAELLEQIETKRPPG